VHRIGHKAGLPVTRIVRIMKIKESLKEHILSYLIQTMFGLVGLLSLTIASLFVQMGLVPKVSDLNPIPLARAVLALIGLCSFLTAYIIYSFPKYKTRFYVKWNKKGDPFCPACERPMAENSRDNGSILSCPKCPKSNIRLQYEDGRYIYIEEARLMIIKGITLDEIRKK